MRRWLFVLLLCLLPAQMIWAAATPYCAHERDSAAKQHFGHHEHQHKTGAAVPGGESDPAPAGAQDPDCETCHFGCAITLPATGIRIVFVPAQLANTVPASQDTSYIPSGPERPDRA